MTELYNLDLFSLGILITAIGILGFVIYINDRKSATHRIFFLFSLITIAYSLVNYLAYQGDDPVVVLWLLRFVLFASVWHAFVMFHLFYTFPEKTVTFPRWYTHLLIPWVILVSLITLTPITFSRILGPVIVGQVTNPERGPGMVLFGMTVVLLVASGVLFIIRKTLRASKYKKQPFQLVLIGTIITFTLLIFSNFILPVIFDILNFIPLATVYFLPFIVFSAYAIIKHHLLDVKIVTTEIFASVLAAAMFLEVIVAHEPKVIAVRVIVFLLVLAFGIMLIRSVQREVEQRAALEKLTRELRLANKRLRELDKIRSEFLSFASHQVKTPMTVVKGYASMIADGSLGNVPPDVQKIASEIENSSNVMIALVNNLLDYRRIEEGRMEYAFEPVKIGDFISTCVESLRPLAAQKNLELTFKSEVGDTQCSIDQQKFQQVIQNLVDNAIKYTEKGSIHVTIEYNDAEKQKIRLEITDTGYGMSADLIPQLFSQFTRGKGETKKIRGTGLGLYIAKQIVISHKGQIIALSSGEGQGSTFQVILPVATV